MRKEKEIAPKLPPPPSLPSPKTKTQNPIAVEEQWKLKKESKRGKKEANAGRRTHGEEFVEILLSGIN